MKSVRSWIIMRSVIIAALTAVVEAVMGMSMAATVSSELPSRGAPASCCTAWTFAFSAPESGLVLTPVMNAVHAVVLVMPASISACTEDSNIAGYSL